MILIEDEHNDYIYKETLFDVMNSYFPSVQDELSFGIESLIERDDNI